MCFFLFFYPVTSSRSPGNKYILRFFLTQDNVALCSRSFIWSCDLRYWLSPARNFHYKHSGCFDNFIVMTPAFKLPVWTFAEHWRRRKERWKSAKRKYSCWKSYDIDMTSMAHLIRRSSLLTFVSSLWLACLFSLSWNSRHEPRGNTVPLIDEHGMVPFCYTIESGKNL